MTYNVFSYGTLNPTQSVSHYYVDAAYCYRRSSVVCLSVCRSVCGNREPSKNGWTDRDAVWGADSGGPRNHVLHIVSVSPREGAILREDVICTANGWLKEQDQPFFYNGFRAFEKRRTKCRPISAAGNYVEKWQNMMYIYLVIKCVSLRTLWMPLVPRQGLHSSADTLTVPPTLPSLGSGRSQLQFRLHGTPYSLTFSTLQTLLLLNVTLRWMHLFNLYFTIFKW